MHFYYLLFFVQQLADTAIMSVPPVFINRFLYLLYSAPLEARPPWTKRLKEKRTLWWRFPETKVWAAAPAKSLNQQSWRHHKTGSKSHSEHRTKAKSSLTSRRREEGYVKRSYKETTSTTVNTEKCALEVKKCYKIKKQFLHPWVNLTATA